MRNFLLQTDRPQEQQITVGQTEQALKVNFHTNSLIADALDFIEEESALDQTIQDGNESDSS